MTDSIDIQRPALVEAAAQSGKVELAESAEVIANTVLDGEVTVLKNVFDEEHMHRVRRHVMQWGESYEPEDVHVPYAEKSFHRFDKNPQGTDHPRQFHTYCFYDLLTERELDEAHQSLDRVFRTLHSLHGTLVDRDDQFDLTYERPHYHPQVIHYPSGGGYFGLHKHEFAPTRIGMILSLAKRGETFERGGVRFQDGGTTYETAADHDIGDVLLFKYDLPHAVYPIDPEAELDWSSEAGRWSLIMPYHRREMEIE